MASNADYIASTEKRRASKPLIEKRRRARINKSLRNLVEMLAPPGRTSESRTPRMEKAQILEMTVDYVKKVTQSRLHLEMPSCNKHETSFQDGYKSCLDEVCNFFQKSSGRPSEDIFFQALLHYLDQKRKPQSSSSCCASNNSNTSSSNTQAAIPQAAILTKSLVN
ncbi:BHLH domain-containing protein [Trichonephila clavata]|uniref:BHLH domain-containing protein n=1 Tax=Trichonephila clavata TaxID=2740835 RepID=A0A8X6HKI5_TRICU|nr:BHLH domain-containing protein [Trichonephila clavata]